MYAREGIANLDADSVLGDDTILQRILSGETIL
jgi:hypothetical protein